MNRSPAIIASVAVCAMVTALTGGAGAAPAAAAPTGAPVLLRDGLAGSDVVPHEVLPVQADTTVEPSIAVNPQDPLNAVIGFQAGRVDAGGDATNGFATTKDGGKTWKNGIIPKLTQVDGGEFDRASDAVIAFGLGGLVYFSSLVFDDTSSQGLRSAIVSSTSHDGGLTWDLPTVVQDDLGGGLNDKNWEIVDNSSAPGHHLGRVYVVWDRVAGVIAKYSDDKGVTWVPASPAFTPNVYVGQGIGSYPVVTPSGDLVVAFMADAAPPAVTGNPGEDLAEAVAGLSRITVTRFPAAGTIPTGAPLPAGITTAVATFEGNGVRQQRAGGLLAAAVDTSSGPHSGRLYVTWEDARFRSDAANDAVLSTSDDDGVTWTTPKRVNPGKTNDQLDHYNPSVAVGPDGRVDLIWRQRQESAAGTVATLSTTVGTYLSRSRDGGATFGAPLQVSTAPSNTRFGAFSRDGLFQGDYDEVASVGDYTYVVRSESYAPSAGIAAPATPSAATVHHQPTWVAVIRSAGAAPVTKPAAPTRPTAPTPPAQANPSHGLAATGGSALLGLAGLLLLLAAGLIRRRRSA